MTIPLDIKVYPNVISTTQYTVTVEPALNSLKALATWTSGTCTIGTYNPGTLTFPFMQMAYDYFYNNYSDGILTTLNSGGVIYHLGERYYLDVSMIETFFKNPTGTSSQVVRGDGTIGSVPAGSYYDLTTKPAAKSFDNAPTRSFVTTAAAANGFRLSTFRDAEVSYSVSIDTTISLSGNSSGVVVLEVAATNSTTASDWKTISRIPSGQSGGLVVGLTLNQAGGGNLSGIVPAGWYARLRTINVAGTPTFTFNGGQETLDEPLQVAA